MEALVRRARDDIFDLNTVVEHKTTGVVYAAAYGVISTNTAGANTTAMNAAIAAANSAKCPIVLPAGTLQLNALNALQGNSVVLEGRGLFGGTTLSFNNSTGDCITLSQMGHMGLRNVHITAAVRRTSGYAIATANSPFKPTVESVRIDYHWNGINVASGSNIKLDKIAMRYMHGDLGVNVRGANAATGVYGLVIAQLDCDNPYPVFYGPVRTWAASTAYTAGEIISVNGRIYQCSTGGTSASSGTGPNAVPGAGPIDAFNSTVTDGTAQWRFVCRTGLTWVVQDSFSYSCSVSDSTLINGGYGYIMRDTSNTGTSFPMWFNSIGMEVDHPFDNCVALLRGEGFYASQAWWGSSLQARGILIDSTYRGEVSVGEGSRIVGNWLDGVLVQAGPTQVVIANNFIGLNSQASLGTHHGIALAASVTDITITGNHIGRTPQGNGRQGLGISIGAGGARRIVTGNNLTGNHTGGTDDTTNSGSVIFANNLV